MEWMTLLNGHILHCAYDYFTYKHDEEERVKTINPTPECLNALHDPAIKKHMD